MNMSNRELGELRNKLVILRLIAADMNNAVGALAGSFGRYLNTPKGDPYEAMEITRRLEEYERLATRQEEAVNSLEERLNEICA